MPAMTVVIGNFDGGKKFLKYTKNLDLDARVHVFNRAIRSMVLPKSIQKLCTSNGCYGTQL
jgi:hypothetical protein